MKKQRLESFLIWMKPSLKTKLALVAKREHRSMTAVLIKLLEDAK